MNVIKSIVALCLFVSFLAAAESSLTIKFTTGSYYGRYAPRHCIAVWITDESGNFVKTLQINGRYPNYRRMLASWVKASKYDSTDAVTSASINAHRSHTTTWDLTDLQGNKVSNGVYKVWIEQTEDNSSFPGYVPLAELDLEINDQSTELTFDDLTFKNRKAIFDISLSLFIDGSPVTKSMKVAAPEKRLSVNGSKLSLVTSQSGEFAVQILNARGQEVLAGKTSHGVFTLQNLSKGIYFARFTQGNTNIVETFQY